MAQLKDINLNIVSQPKGEPLCTIQNINNNNPVFVKHNEYFYCTICYFTCLQNHEKQLHQHQIDENFENIQISNEQYQQCQCQYHIDDKLKKKQAYSELIKNEYSQRKLLVIADIFHSDYKNYATGQQEPLLNQIFNQEIDYIKEDLVALKNNSFSWSHINSSDVEKRANFINFFNGEFSVQALQTFNIAKIDNLVPKEYLIFILNQQESHYGYPIYNAVLNLQSFALKFFQNFYFYKNTHNLLKLEPLNIQNTYPEDRILLRNFNKKQVLNQFQYLYDMCKNLLHLYIPDISWRWIGGNHKAHIYVIQIIKHAIALGLFDNQQIDELLDILVIKMNNLRQLEIAVDRDSSNVSHKWINIWSSGLQEIRQLYIEIIILAIYQRFDEKLFLQAQNLQPQQPNKNKQQDQFYVQKNKTQQEFGVNFIENEWFEKLNKIVLSYVLNRKTILENTLINKDTEKLSIEFFNFQFNYKDGYLKGLENSQQLQKNLPSLQIENEFSQELDIQRDLDKLISSYFIQKQHAFKEKQFIDQFLLILDPQQKIQHLKSVGIALIVLPKALNVIILFKHFFEKQQQENQNLNFQDNLKQIQITNSQQKREQNIGNTIGKLFYFAFLHRENSGLASLLFSKSYMPYLEAIINLWPSQIFEQIGAILANNPKFCQGQTFLQKLMFTGFKQIGRKIMMNESGISQNNYHEIYQCFQVLIEILLKFVKQDTNEMNQILTLSSILTEFFPHLIKPQDLLSDLKNDPNSLKVQYQFSLINLLNTVSYNMYLNETLMMIKENFNQNQIQDILKACIKHQKQKEIIMDLFYIFLVDNKENLASERKLYYIQKPLDILYSEDIFSPNNYSEVINIMIHEIENKDNNFQFIQNFIYPCISKLVHLFLRADRKDFEKINVYTQDFENLFKTLIKDGKLSLQEQNSYDLIIIICQKINIYLESIQKPILGQIKLPQRNVYLINRDYKSKELLQYSENKDERVKYYCEQIEHPQNLEKQSITQNYIKIKAKIQIYETVKIFDQNFQTENKYKLKNLAHFLITFLSKENNGFQEIYTVIKLFINMSFRNGRVFLHYLAELLPTHMKFFDNLWHELRHNLNIIRYKGITDQQYENCYQKIYLNLKLQTLLVKESVVWQDFYGNLKIQNDIIDRNQRLTTYIEKISDENKIKEDVPFMRNDLIEIMEQILRLMTQIIKNNLKNKKQVYHYILDKYRAILKKDDEKFLNLQLQVLEYLTELCKDNQNEIIQYLGLNIPSSLITDLLVRVINNYYQQNLNEDQKIQQKNYMQDQKKQKQIQLKQNSHKDLEKQNLLSQQQFQQINKFTKNDNDINLKIAIQCYAFSQLIQNNKEYQTFLQDSHYQNYKNYLQQICLPLDYQNQQGQIKNMVIFDDNQSKYITQKTKEEFYYFNDETNKPTIQDKIIHLYKFLPIIQQEIRIQKQSKLTKILMDNLKYIIYLGFIISLVINILFTIKEEENLINNKNTYNNTIKVLGYILLICTGISLLLYLFFLLKLEFKRNTFIFSLKHKKCNLLQKLWILIFSCLFFNHIAGPLCFLLYSSIGGLYITGANYSIGLLVFVTFFKKTQDILVDCSRNAFKIWGLFVLLIIFAFIYGFFYYDGLNQTQDQCQTVFECFLQYLYVIFPGQGLLLILEGDSYQRNINFQTLENANRFFFQLSAFLIFYIGFISILIGLILDGLRRGTILRKNIKQLKQSCLICGKSKQYIIKNGELISVHLQNHNIWRYSTFMLSLLLKCEQKKELDCTQNYILNKIQNQDTTWFPYMIIQ